MPAVALLGMWLQGEHEAIEGSLHFFCTFNGVLAGGTW